LYISQKQFIFLIPVVLTAVDRFSKVTHFINLPKWPWAERDSVCIIDAFMASR